MRRLRFKQFLSERNQFSRNGEETLLSVSEYYGVKPRAEAFEGEEHETRAATLEGYRIAKKDDLVMNYMLAWKGAYGVSTYDGIVSPAYSVFEVKKDIIDCRYLHHKVRSDDMKAYFRSRSKGIIESRLRLYPDSLLASYVEIPDLPTQHAIANFLDRETARIDTLIEKKQRFVELLGEKFEAMAAALSTGSLSTDIEIDSKIDWLGYVPSSWSVEKVYWHFYASKGRDAQKYTKEYCGANEGEHPVYSGQTSNEGVMGRIDTYDYDFGETGVLFATTVGAKAMDLRFLSGKFSLSQNCMIIIPRRRIPLKFFLYQMRVLFRKERQLIPDHMQASFRVEDLNRYRIALPPLDTAKKIGLEIEKAETVFRRIVEPVNASIDRLKEYRSALITSAVTGQIDVTKWTNAGTNDRQLDAIEEEFGA